MDFTLRESADRGSTCASRGLEVAVHYFPRGSYGSPQSLGCIELPLGAAGTAWPYLTYGSLVTITG